jgi:hypothetical protein
MSETRNLPSLQELVSDLDVYEKHDQFNFLVNQLPPPSWVTKHNYIKVENEKGQKVPYEYLPIDKVEYLLRKIFKAYRIEILREGTAFNGVYVVVRVHYIDIVTSQWEYHDGVGAIQLQVKSGSSPADLANINNGALSMAFPHAKTLAVKDACDMFGKLFGADLNRRGTLNASLDAARKTPEEQLAEIKELLEVDGLRLSEEDRMNIERIIEDKEVIRYKKCISELKSKLPKN